MTATPAPALNWTTVTTVDGPFTMLFDEDAVVYASGWTDSPEYLAGLIAPSLRRDELHRQSCDALADAVGAYYAGDFDAPAAVTVRQAAGPFVEASWSALRGVRAGEPVTYGRLAERAGRPAAVRGAAACCVRNAAALFVPCHRVIRADGGLGGFRYGLDLKRALLDREARSLEASSLEATG
ncbi:methylated-DNA--[protein]-cysteine S-methyltransferase [Gordonia neofelifaecis]|uniref:Methylated-DNA/protein-cysteinemethyltransferase n=1 Tax=Gordonia neofelifaecis NRRL B-59395 TaxID=644548 RepID=F1YEG9_9ACTN|nr:methylated-DNA--[protein]-cysteine S-methyltransferase [Gordonia neofelifaecis]EGD56802.1 methylated-DNA/protein-cysteinemethyltransferase [Gordonia neofelifaecis NRRL B-59395]